LAEVAGGPEPGPVEPPTLRPPLPVRALCALTALGVLAGACTGRRDAGPTPTKPERARIEYRVTGPVPSVSLRYGNKHSSRRLTVELPWSHVGSAFGGTTVVLDASQPSGPRGYRLSCVLSITIPGHSPLVHRDSSHIVGIKAEGGSQNVVYDGKCNTSAVVSLTGLP
jgi:hypothetical protein